MKRQKLKTSKPINVCYCRVSTKDQDLAKFKPSVLEYANNQDFGKIQFVEKTVSGKKPWKDRKLFEVVEGLKSGDRLIVPELSRLGRSTLDCLEILKFLNDIYISAIRFEHKQVRGIQLDGFPCLFLDDPLNCRLIECIRINFDNSPIRHISMSASLYIYVSFRQIDAS